jgi:hypothetical protein
MPPEPLTRGLPPLDPRSLCPLSSTEFVEPPPLPRTKFLGTPLSAMDANISRYSQLAKCFVVNNVPWAARSPPHKKTGVKGRNTVRVVLLYYIVLNQQMHFI